MASGGWDLLRHRDFSLVCGGRFLVSFAMNMQNVAIGWFVYDVTGDPFALGLLGLAGLLPALGLILVTGYAADRFERRTILAVSSVVMVLTALILLYQVASGSQIIWPIYFILALFSSARAFFNTSISAILPNLVPPQQLSSAIAFSSGAFQGASIAGPAVGGILYAVELRLPFIVGAALFVAAASLSYAIRYRAESLTGAKTWRGLLAGIEFAWSRPVVFGAISLDLVAVMFGSVVALLPIFAKDILDVGPIGLGILRAAPAIGSVVMAFALAHATFIYRNAGPRLFQSVALYGVATVLFGLSEVFWLSVVCLAIAGAADMVSVVIRHTLVLTETPDDLRGRVTAFNSLFTSTSGELGQLRGGVLAGLFGAVPAVLIGGGVVVGLAAVWAWMFPDLRKRDHLVEEKVETARA